MINENESLLDGGNVIDKKYMKDLVNQYNKLLEEGSTINNELNILKENESLYKMLLSSDIYVKFINQIKGIIIDYISNDKRFNNLSSDKRIREAQIDLISNGIIYLYVDYFKGQLNVSLDDLLFLVEDFIRRLIK